MVPQYYFDVICCPKCKSDLEKNPGNEKELICSDCKSTYPVIDDIPLLFDKSEDEAGKIVKDFYDSEWKRNENGILRARILHEDLSDLGQIYMLRNEDRFVSLFKKSEGKYFLDAGSGAEPKIEFGSSYSYHICLDFSIDGLIECRQVLGNRAICIAGSLLSIPIKDSVCNGIIAAHCLYHINKDLQHNVISEFSRVLSFKGKMLIFYANPNSLERRLIILLKKILGIKKRNTADNKTLYYYAHPIENILDMLFSEFANSKVSVRLLRMFSIIISEPAFKYKIWGRMFLRLFFLIERFQEKKVKLATYVSYIVER